MCGAAGGRLHPPRLIRFHEGEEAGHAVGIVGGLFVLQRRQPHAFTLGLQKCMTHRHLGPLCRTAMPRLRSISRAVHLGGFGLTCSIWGVWKSVQRNEGWD